MTAWCAVFFKTAHKDVLVEDIVTIHCCSDWFILALWIVKETHDRHMTVIRLRYKCDADEYKHQWPAPHVFFGRNGKWLIYLLWVSAVCTSAVIDFSQSLQNWQKKTQPFVRGMAWIWLIWWIKSNPRSHSYAII